MNTFWHRLPRPFSILAPMEDVTDVAFRELIRVSGRPDVFFTEFTSIDGLLSKGREKVAQRLLYCESQRPIVAQIWGTSPERYCRAAQELALLGFDGIDLNMGCPVSKITKAGACSALIENPSLAREIYIASKEGAAGVPVSIKTRLGFRDWRTEEWSTTLLELAPPAITVHGRIAKQLSKKACRWDEIARVVELRNTISPHTLIVGNGDVFSQAEIHEKHQQHGVDGVMIGRGVFQNPFIFQSDGREFGVLPSTEKIRFLQHHMQIFDAFWRGQKPYAVLKKYFKIAISNFDGASDLRAKLMETNSSQEGLQILSRFVSERS